ncbi:MAG TPA: hypothetical protein VLF91_06570 [Candidatus Saccharimonadales bacterium]|nr:hypothetical protein [Candidatus Saccharimonadales bacterium]
MKTKNSKQQKPFHLHLEYFFRKQYCLLFVMTLIVFAVIKSDGRALSLWRQAYAQGFGIIGQYMREETTRVPVTFEISAKLPTISAGA